MAAHELLKRSGYANLGSFGTNAHCKLPGPSIDRPNIYAFGVGYQQIYDDLLDKDPELVCTRIRACV